MSNKCQHIIKKKNRQCLNYSLPHSIYCHIHQNGGQLDDQNGGQLEDKPYISPYVLTSSQLPPNPNQQSWYHYQAPVYQSFGDYICIKKDFLINAKNLVTDVLINAK